MFRKYELIGAGISVMCMAAALFLVQQQTSPLVNSGSLAGQVAASDVVVVEGGENVTSNRTAAYKQAADASGKINRMVVDDVKIGTGEAVKAGDTVSVHYAGTLQNGQEFDNSKKRGAPFEFTVGAGQVIKGWDEGLVGMQVGGERILVIPPAMAYGDQGIGPIPGGATLVFSIELVEIK